MECSSPKIKVFFKIFSGHFLKNLLIFQEKNTKSTKNKKSPL